MIFQSLRPWLTLNPHTLLVAVLCVALAAVAFYFVVQATVRAHQDTPVAPMPSVGLDGVSPSGTVSEGTHLRVTVRLSRAITEHDDTDRARCYDDSSPPIPKFDGNPCIEGGIVVSDPGVDNHLIAFVFRKRDTDADILTKVLTHTIGKDNCDVDTRNIKIWINTAFDKETYGYTIESDSTFEGSNWVITVKDGNDAPQDPVPDSCLYDHPYGNGSPPPPPPPPPPQDPQTPGNGNNGVMAATVATAAMAVLGVTAATGGTGAMAGAAGAESHRLRRPRHRLSTRRRPQIRLRSRRRRP